MTIIDQLVQSPRLPQYVQQLEEILEAEGSAREKFYDAITEGQKTEFINGEVIVQSPVKFEHSDASDNLLTLLRTYVRRHSLGHVGHEKLLVCLTRNDYEPDISFWNASKAAAFKPKQMKFPAPDFVVEVLSPATEKIDRKIKFEDYAAHGTDEYWIVDPDARLIEQYLLKGDQFELAVKVRNGIIRSRAIQGLEISVEAAFDAQANMRALETIMKS